MTPALIVTGYLLCSFIAARLLLRLWWREFGEYDGVVGLDIFVALTGPCGFMVMSMITAMIWAVDHEPKGFKRTLDLVRGKAQQ